jgi:hypothetical protein
MRHGRRTNAASTDIRILALPALLMTFTRLASFDLTLKSVLVIQAAMPAAIFPIIVAKAHHGYIPPHFELSLNRRIVAP